jgi:hypothetical protein
LGLDLYSLEGLANHVRTPLHTILATAPISYSATKIFELDNTFVPNRIVEDVTNVLFDDHKRRLTHNCFGLTVFSMMADQALRFFAPTYFRILNSVESQNFMKNTLSSIEGNFYSVYHAFLNTVGDQFEANITTDSGASRRYIVEIIHRITLYFTVLFLALRAGDRFQPRRLAELQSPDAPLSTYKLWGEVVKVRHVRDPGVANAHSEEHRTYATKYIIWLFVLQYCQEMRIEIKDWRDQLLALHAPMRRPPRR